MCALINWFTQRLSHVDITLVQGLIVDFYYDKLLMEEWIVTAADFGIDFCATQKQSRRLWFIDENFPIPNDEKVCFLSHSFMIIFGAKKVFHSIPMGQDLSLSLFHELALVSDSAAIDHSSRDSFQLMHFMFHASRRKNSKTLPTSYLIQRGENWEKLFCLCTSDSQAVFMKHFQGGHVMKCKQIS